MSIFEPGQGELLFRLPFKARPDRPSAIMVTENKALVIHTSGEVRFLEFEKKEE